MRRWSLFLLKYLKIDENRPLNKRYSQTVAFYLLTMSIFEQYNVTPEDLGIKYPIEFDHESPLVLAHAKATASARDSYQAWRTWNGGRTKAEFYKEDQKRKYQYLEDEQERLKTRQALHLSLGPAYQDYAKRLEAEAEEAFNDQIQADLDQTFE